MKRGTNRYISQLVEGPLAKMQRHQAHSNWTVRLGKMAGTDRREKMRSRRVHVILFCEGWWEKTVVLKSRLEEIQKDRR